MILTGWKEISRHLRFAVRSVQRWESAGLPVKRISESPRSPVVADSDELDAWILRRTKLPAGAPRNLHENQQRAHELHREVERSKKQFQLQVERFKKQVAEFRAKYQR